MILYIHGFRSTQNSAKAKLLKKQYKEQIHIADFSHIPDKAIEELDNIIKELNITGIIASSLGGFYATYLSEKYNLKTTLINPSTKPYETLRRYLGANETYDGDPFEWKEEYLEQLKNLSHLNVTSSNYLLFLQKGDEILDYSVAQGYYNGAKMTIEDGGNHRFQSFERHFEKLNDFLSIPM